MSTVQTHIAILGFKSTYKEVKVSDEIADEYAYAEDGDFGYYYTSGSEVYFGLPLAISDEYEGFEKELALDLEDIKNKMPVAQKAIKEKLNLDVPVRLIVATLWH
jgi:hypothetical protein